MTGQIEFVYPDGDQTDLTDELKNHIPFQALPDGAHATSVKQNLTYSGWLYFLHALK
jgi:hypothetical protein